LPSTRAIETRSLPTSLAATHRGFAFYVASPKSSIPDRDVFYVAHPIRSIREQAVQLRMESIRLVDAAAFGATDNVWRTKCVLFKCRVLADR
jgi:hypothetical protein